MFAIPPQTDWSRFPVLPTGPDTPSDLKAQKGERRTAKLGGQVGAVAYQQYEVADHGLSPASRNKRSVNPAFNQNPVRRSAFNCSDNGAILPDFLARSRIPSRPVIVR